MRLIKDYIKEGLKITSKTKVNEKPKYNYFPKDREELKDILENPNNKRRLPTSSPNVLYLYKIKY